MRTPHTCCKRGKRVRVILLSGEQFIDKFWEKAGRFVYFQKHEKVRTGEIRAFTIVKGRD